MNTALFEMIHGLARKVDWMDQLMLIASRILPLYL